MGEEKLNPSLVHLQHVLEKTSASASVWRRSSPWMNLLSSMANFFPAAAPLLLVVSVYFLCLTYIASRH